MKLSNDNNNIEKNKNKKHKIGGKIGCREKVNIPPMKAFITIEGGGAEKTTVEWGDTAQTPDSRGFPMGTFNSASFAVNSPFFVAKNITFKVNLLPFP